MNSHTIQKEWVALESPTMPTAGHGSQPCQGIYHRPSNKKPTVAFIAAHYNVDFGEHYLGPTWPPEAMGFWDGIRATVGMRRTSCLIRR